MRRLSFLLRAHEPAAQEPDPSSDMTWHLFAACRPEDYATICSMLTGWQQTGGRIYLDLHRSKRGLMLSRNVRLPK